MANQPTFYFYDLETSGVRPSTARIMQFAGQRTDMDLKPIGEPDNVLIKMTNDTVPEPDAILITGITPQKTVAEGLSEAEFLTYFHNKVVVPDTIFVGFNSVRFDDEFMRYLHYRNFYDPYEWEWKNDCSRWDLLDVVRMTRALRPEGIKWPVDSNGKPSNRLGLLTGINKLTHTDAHDALGDVLATIELAKLLKTKQPKLFQFLLGLRTKQAVDNFAGQNPVFVYSSGKYATEFEKTTVVAQLARHPKRQAVLVYDLRQDPTPFAKLKPEALATAWGMRPDQGELVLPVKTMQFNRCPAIAPPSVLDIDSKKRLAIDDTTVKENLKKLQKLKDFQGNVLKALEILDKKQQAQLFAEPHAVDTQLYDGFFTSQDKSTLDTIRHANPNEFADKAALLKDKRLKALLPLYKARNFPHSLTPEEHETWETFRLQSLTSGGQNSSLARFFTRLEELNATVTTKEAHYLLEELKLWGESILPEDAVAQA